MMITLFGFSFSEFSLQQFQPMEAKFPEENCDSLSLPPTSTFYFLGK